MFVGGATLNEITQFISTRLDTTLNENYAPDHIPGALLKLQTIRDDYSRLLQTTNVTIDMIQHPDMSLQIPDYIHYTVNNKMVIEDVYRKLAIDYINTHQEIIQNILSILSNTFIDRVVYGSSINSVFIFKNNREINTRELTKQINKYVGTLPLNAQSFTKSSEIIIKCGDWTILQCILLPLSLYDDFYITMPVYNMLNVAGILMTLVHYKMENPTFNSYENNQQLKWVLSILNPAQIRSVFMTIAKNANNRLYVTLINTIYPSIFEKQQARFTQLIKPYIFSFVNYINSMLQKSNNGALVLIGGSNIDMKLGTSTNAEINDFDFSYMSHDMSNTEAVGTQILIELERFMNFLVYFIAIAMDPSSKKETIKVDDIETVFSMASLRFQLRVKRFGEYAMLSIDAIIQNTYHTQYKDPISISQPYSIVDINIPLKKREGFNMAKMTVPLTLKMKGFSTKSIHSDSLRMLSFYGDAYKIILMDIVKRHPDKIAKDKTRWNGISSFVKKYKIDFQNPQADYEFKDYIPESDPKKNIYKSLKMNCEKAAVSYQQCISILNAIPYTSLQLNDNIFMYTNIHNSLVSKLNQAFNNPTPLETPSSPPQPTPLPKAQQTSLPKAQPTSLPKAQPTPTPQPTSPPKQKQKSPSPSPSPPAATPTPTPSLATQSDTVTKVKKPKAKTKAKAKVVDDDMEFLNAAIMAAENERKELDELRISNILKGIIEPHIYTEYVNTSNAFFKNKKKNYISKINEYMFWYTEGKPLPVFAENSSKYKLYSCMHDLMNVSRFVFVNDVYKYYMIENLDASTQSSEIIKHHVVQYARMLIDLSKNDLEFLNIFDSKDHNIKAIRMLCFDTTMLDVLKMYMYTHILLTSFQVYKMMEENCQKHNFLKRPDDIDVKLHVVKNFQNKARYIILDFINTMSDDMALAIYTFMNGYIVELSDKMYAFMEGNTFKMASFGYLPEKNKPHYLLACSIEMYAKSHMMIRNPTKKDFNSSENVVTLTLDEIRDHKKVGHLALSCYNPEDMDMSKRILSKEMDAKKIRMREEILETIHTYFNNEILISGPVDRICAYAVFKSYCNFHYSEPYTTLAIEKIHMRMSLERGVIANYLEQIPREYMSFLFKIIKSIEYMGFSKSLKDSGGYIVFRNE